MALFAAAAGLAAHVAVHAQAQGKTNWTLDTVLQPS